MNLIGFAEKHSHASYQSLKQGFRNKVDPWNFENSNYERGRFEKMLKIAKKLPHKKILEIGCAEGHFTQRLQQISEKITAIDLSQVAISRARRRAPKARYFCTTLEKMPLPQTLYDLVICSEVFYYIDDKKSAVDKIKKLAKFLLTSNYMLHPLLVEPYLAKLTLLERVIHFSLRELKICSISAWEIG